MQMTVECPTDGEVSVDVGDVKAIVFDRDGRCEISFTCPLCGAELRQIVTPIAMQMAIVQSVDLDGAEGDEEGLDASEAVDVTASGIDPELEDAYLEYFRRQLDHIEDAEAALKEIDG
jgi:hypothetical protein